MRNFLLTSVALSALMAGIATSTAQQDQGRSGTPPAAQQSQPSPRADSEKKDQPSSQVQRQDTQQNRRGRTQNDLSATGPSSQGQADEPNERTRRNAQDEDRTPAARRRSEADRSRTPSRERSTTNQSQERGDAARQTPRRETRQRDTAQDRDAQIDRRQENAGQENAGQDKVRPDNARQDGTSRGAMRLSDEQRTRVTARFSNSIDRMNVRPLARSQISVSIGATIPRSVRAYAVPSSIVSIYPRFRGHRFVVVEDEIVIIEPRSHRIVSVLPMSGERRTARSTVRETTGAAAAGSRLRLSQQERETIRTVVMREPACRLEQRLDFVLFIPVPRTVEICELPPQIVSDVPEVSRYRYVVRGDEVALVDPQNYSVVEVIR
jgi:hypothetical protein